MERNEERGTGDWFLTGVVGGVLYGGNGRKEIKRRRRRGEGEDDQHGPTQSRLFNSRPEVRRDLTS